MRPDERELDEEIRGHLAINIKERVDRGEDPVSARRAALHEFGYVPAVRDAVHRVWYSRAFDAIVALLRDMRIGLRSLARTKALTATVIVTLALGIGANAAIFSVVRGVLFRPLVNRDEARLVYLRQSAPGIKQDNMTFSVPEIEDFKSRTKTIAAFGDFSTIEFTMIGLGPEPRTIRAGVVGGSFFDVMGLRPVLGRLLTAADDGEHAAPVVVLTHRYWTTSLKSDSSVMGKQVRLGTVTATVVGVLEPAVPYPTDTEIIANMVASPHHLGATMATNRSHRMTELFARLVPDATLDSARADVLAAHTAMMREHPESYAAKARVTLDVTTLRDQIVAPARTVLILLLAAAAVVFFIAVSNVTNLILARSIRREGELAVRAALGASRAALRRTLLAESLVLCVAGAALGVLIAGPFVAVIARFAARFSVRALDVTIDPSLLWVGGTLAVVAAILLAYTPKLPTAQAPGGLGLSNGVRITPGTNRRLRLFATTQIAFSFVLLAGAATLIASLMALKTDEWGDSLSHVVVFDVTSFGQPAEDAQVRYEEMSRQIGALHDVRGVALGSTAPWRDAGSFQPYQFLIQGFTPATGESDPFARLRVVGPKFFAMLGVPIIEGRDFSDVDRRSKGDVRDYVAIISQSVAQRLFPKGDALNQVIVWTDPVLKLYAAPPRRIVGVVADIDDENIVPGPAMTVYQPTFGFGGFTRRLFVHTAGDPYAIVAPVTKIMHELAPEQPVERPATLGDVRAEVLAPERLKVFVLTGFAGIALLIAVVGVAGVLAFSVSARTRDFGVRLALGSTPRFLLLRVVVEGAAIVGIGIGAGAAAGCAFTAIATVFVEQVRLPGLVPVAGAAAVLAAAGVIASLVPAARASRVDVVEALRAD